MHAKKPGEAAAVLELLAKQTPRDGALLWYLGGVYLHDLTAPEKALPHFRKAVRLNPESERASLGLFHTLWELGKEDAALRELKRFQVLSNFSCKDYREIIAELNEKLAAGE